MRQGDLRLYTTSIKVRDLTSDGFYSVETLDPDDGDGTGYQRLLNNARAKRLADYVVKGQERRDAFLPTSVFLATDKHIPYDEISNTISFDISQVGPFSVVDGQHRLEGLKLAAQKDPQVLDFEVAVNIAVDLPWIAQMCHFLIVNTTQKSVDASVEQRIIARLTEGFLVEEIPSLPRWIRNTVEKGEVGRALKIVQYLNDAPLSPWCGKVQMANETSKHATINQRSFVKSIVKYVLTENNPLSILQDLEKEKNIFLNYWKAIATQLDDSSPSVLYKYNGAELFCKFSIPFFTKLQTSGDFTLKTMQKWLVKTFDNIDDEFAGVAQPEFWYPGQAASFMNAGAINKVYQSMTKALHRASVVTDFEY